MSSYPQLEINLKKIYHNAKTIIEQCHEQNVSVAGVIKGVNGYIPVAKQFENAGADYIASSRIREIINFKNGGIDLPTMLIRIPMISEIDHLIEWVDISLNSELETIKAINQAAKEKNKIHKIILMQDLGDLREGYFDTDELMTAALTIENEFKHIELLGLGANLSCYGSIVPTPENMTQLIETSKTLEQTIGRPLEIVSGGATTSLPLLFDNKMPEGINNLRIGEAILLARDLEDYWGYDLSHMYKDTIQIKAEVIEIKTKASHPIGKIFIDAFGNTPDYTDIGQRKRALLALGKKDIGHHDKLIPKNQGIQLVGSSSDHLIIDIEDYHEPLTVGDILTFEVYYQAMLCASFAPDVTIKYV